MTAPAPQSQPDNRELRHTPLPWKFSPWHIEEGPSAVLAPAGHIVCTTASDDDATFIVEAVNSHAALKSRVEELTKVLDQISREGECVYARQLARNAVGSVAMPLERSGGAT